MPENPWHDRIVTFCADHQISHIEAVNSLLGKEYYNLAHVQFTCGASPRVVESLLKRAAVDANLIDPE